MRRAHVPKMPRWVRIAYPISLIVLGLAEILLTSSIFTHAIDVFLFALSALLLYWNVPPFVHRHDFYYFTLEWLDSEYGRAREPLEFLIMGSKGYPYVKDGGRTLVLTAYGDRKRVIDVFGKDPKMSLMVVKTRDQALALSMIERAFRQKHIRTVKPDVLEALDAESRDKAKALQVVYG